jgi:hypothetical protein
VAATKLQQDGKYHVFASESIKMDPHPDPEVERLQNAERVLDVAEEFIRRSPEQWSVPLPVWPQVMDLIPN